MAKRNLKGRDSIKSLKKRVRLKKYSDIRDRIRVIIFALKGSKDVEIAERLDYSVPWVKKWVSRYKKCGFDGLWDQPKPGAPLKLTEDQVIELYQMILSGPAEDELLSRYRVSDIRDFVSQNWGIDYSPSGMHAVMKRMKLSHVTPRPHHPKNDPSVMEQWKKKPRRLSKNNA
jgi:transposase